MCLLLFQRRGVLYFPGRQILLHTKACSTGCGLRHSLLALRVLETVVSQEYPRDAYRRASHKVPDVNRTLQRGKRGSTSFLIVCLTPKPYQISLAFSPDKMK